MKFIADKLTAIWHMVHNSNPKRRRHATCSELPRNHIISKLHVFFNGCAEVPSKLREVFLLGRGYSILLSRLSCLTKLLVSEGGEI